MIWSLQTSKINQSPLILDGAMGSELQKKGLPKNTPSDVWTLENPQAVLNTHQAYQEAGAQILFTNTFGASKNRLSPYQLENRISELNSKAVDLCRTAAGEHAYVAGSVGPIGSKDKPFETLSFYEAADIFQEQIFYLLRSGIDLLVFETFSSVKEIKTATVTADDLCKGKIPVMLLMTVNEEGFLQNNEDPASLLPYLEENHVSIIGFNCSFGPQSILKALGRIKNCTFPIAVKPNAGLPAKNGEYPVFPQQLKDWGKEFLNLGVQLIGGCCGTTPEHIRELSTLINPD